MIKRLVIDKGSRWLDENLWIIYSMRSDDLGAVFKVKLGHLDVGQLFLQQVVVSSRWTIGIMICIIMSPYFRPDLFPTFPVRKLLPYSHRIFRIHFDWFSVLTCACYKLVHRVTWVSRVQPGHASYRSRVPYSHVASQSRFVTHGSSSVDSDVEAWYPRLALGDLSWVD